MIVHRETPNLRDWRGKAERNGTRFNAVATIDLFLLVLRLALTASTLQDVAAIAITVLA